MLRSIAVAVLAAVVGIPVTAASPRYQALRSAMLDGRSVAVNDFTLVRDAYTFTFATGRFHFLQPFEGRTFGAVFVGDGSYELKPATSGELRHLRLVTGGGDRNALADSFDHLVLLFADSTAAEILRAGTLREGAPDPGAARLYEEFLGQQKRDFEINLHLRLLADFLNRPDAAERFFVAGVDGKRYAPALAVYDPLGIGNLSARLSHYGGEETAFLSADDQNGGLWYLAGRKGTAREGRGKPLPRLADAIHYEISTTIGSRAAITGETMIRLQAMGPDVRLLPVNLHPKLRLVSVAVTQRGESKEVEFVQEDVRLGAWKRIFQEEAGDGDAAILFPEPLPSGQPVEVRIRYEGTEVLHATGPSTWSVRARESWYPNLATFFDPATYRMTFRYPSSMTLVSVGTLKKEAVEDGRKVAVWESPGPVRVAGFNYGRFEKISRDDEPTGVHVDVYTERDWTKTAGDAMADALNAVRVATAYFGPAPYESVSVTQQAEWSFGQSWPSLVYLPTLALTTSTQRVFWLDNPLAISSANEFAGMVGWHEMAHQWWGHQVGFESYRDQWLSEGISEFTAALTLQFTENAARHDGYWQKKREEITGRGRGALARHQAGAITQGIRLFTRYSPESPRAMIYDKGAYILHMLRMLMWDPAAEDHDARFIAMMKDFVATYRGKAPSTDDFQKVVERHMIPEMNAAGTGRMDWFFDQWVRGTEIPAFQGELRADPAGDGRYRLKGTLSQSGVSAGFISVVPLYAEFGEGSFGRIGVVRFQGSESKSIDLVAAMANPPKRVVLNLRQDVLAMP